MKKRKIDVDLGWNRAKVERCVDGYAIVLPIYFAVYIGRITIEFTSKRTATHALEQMKKVYDCNKED